MSRVYLDHNATTPLRPEARAAMIAAMEITGNPSSVHAEGRAARAMIERARAQVAAALGCQPTEVIFTSGATEAAGILARHPVGRNVFVQDTAHDCLWAHLNLSNPEMAAPGHIVAMGLANNETGVVSEPVQTDGRWAHGAGLADLLLLDIVQAVGKIPFAFSWSGADMAIVSAHKFGGPKGTGALILRDGLDIPTLQTGGGQESGRRAGTENLIGIAGFGAAAQAAAADLAAGVWDHVAAKRNALEAALAKAAPTAQFIGQGQTRLPNTSCIAVPGWKGETQVMQMDLAGIAVSAGSACSSGKVRPSRVLQAMGYDEVTAASAIRVSLGPQTTDMDIARFCDAWLAEYRRFMARAA